MPRRARSPIAVAAVAVLVGVLTWASVSHAEAPPKSRPSPTSVTATDGDSNPASSTSSGVGSPATSSVGAIGADATTVEGSLSGAVGTAATASSVAPTTLAPTPPAGSTTTIAKPAAAAAPPTAVRPEIGEPLAVVAGPSDAPADPATPAAPDGSEPPVDAAPPPGAVGGAATAGRTALPNPGPLSPNQIDRITVAATPTALRDLLTVSVAFLGAGNIELDHARFSIRFVGKEQRSQSYDATVPNGTLTLAISWTTVAGPISVDDLSVLVVGVAPPTGLRT